VAAEIPAGADVPLTPPRLPPTKSGVADPPPPGEGEARMGETASNLQPPDDPPLAETIARLHRAVTAEIATVEAMREKLRREPEKPIEAGRTARTLASLTATVHKLNCMQMGLPPSAND